MKFTDTLAVFSPRFFEGIKRMHLKIVNANYMLFSHMQTELLPECIDKQYTYDHHNEGKFKC